MGWTLPPMAVKVSHIPGLGFCGLSPIKLCGSSVPEMFPVTSELDESCAVADQGFLAFYFLVIDSFKKLKKVIEAHGMA